MTRIFLDSELLARAMAVSDTRTEEAVTTRTLEEFIARRRETDLLDLMGTLEWDSSADYKAARSRRKS